MASKSKKDAKTASSGRENVAQTAAVQEKEKAHKKSGFGFSGKKTKSKDGENPLPDKGKKKSKLFGGSKGKSQAEAAEQETVRELEGSPVLSRHGLAQTQTTSVEPKHQHPNAQVGKQCIV